jgi:hypothetical protein
MRKFRFVTISSALAMLYGCGGGVDAGQAACRAEIDRKAMESNMSVISVQFNATSTTSEGTLVEGTGQVDAGSKEQPLQFSCVLQGEGDQSSVVRLEITFD